MLFHLHRLSGLALLSLLLLAGLYMLPAGAQVADSHYQISVLSTEQDKGARDLLRLAVACDDEVRRLVGRRPASTVLYLLSDQDRHDLRPGMYVYGIDTTQSELWTAHQLIRGLLFRLVVEMNANPQITHPREVPAWLVAAVHHHVLGRDAPSATRHVYAAMRLLTQHRQLPQWDRFVDRTFTPDLPIFYELQTEASACFLRVLQRHHAMVVRRLLMSVDAARSPSEQLAILLPNELGSDQAQVWFSEQIAKLAYRVDHPGSFEHVREEVQRIEHVSIMVPAEGGGFQVRKVLLEEVPDYLHRYDYSRYNIGSLIKDVFVLIQNAPYVLRESLIMYVEALELLRQGKVPAFSERIQEARGAFSEAYQTGQRTRDYLIKQEQRRKSSAIRLFAYLQAEDPPQHLTEFELQVSALLDQMELALAPPPLSPAMAYRPDQGTKKE